MLDMLVCYGLATDMIRAGYLGLVTTCLASLAHLPLVVGAMAAAHPESLRPVARPISGRRRICAGASGAPRSPCHLKAIAPSRRAFKNSDRVSESGGVDRPWGTGGIVLYAFLCCHDEAIVNSWTKAEDDAVLAKRAKVTDKLAARGKLGPAVRLMPTARRRRCAWAASRSYSMVRLLKPRKRCSASLWSRLSSKRR